MNGYERMSMIKLVLDDDEAFDEAVHGQTSLRDGGDLKVITKAKGTNAGRPIAVLTFSVELPNGMLGQAQTVVTMANLAHLFAALRGRYGSVVEFGF